MTIRPVFDPAERHHDRAQALFRRAREIRELATMARDCAMPGRAFDPDRADKLLGKIERVARGDWEGEA